MNRKNRKTGSAGAIIAILLILAIILGIIAYLGYGYYIEQEHPLKYTNFVERYSRDNGVDKYLVYAVIKTESGFDSAAVSNVGARGLMQIMEDTFEWIKFKMGDEETEYIDMFDPETNIRYGSYLVGYLYEEFGNVEAAMAAYHAGRGQVNKWLSDPDISSDGTHLDTIPIRDTAHYVSKIKKAMDIYIELYDK